MILSGSPHRQGRKNQWSVPTADVLAMVRMYTEEELTVPQIAERLGYTAHTVRGKLTTAKVYQVGRDLSRKPK